ncbi:hypothetical protein CVT26_003456 [Gymnopilus dilepis]|uniref:Protein-S-isoprenylcysteine O-methyltransferase n=1 Tax=Gymnopilus dilepis TaxID=231916 RepID=A0A409Y586_9AGAR|nr:hypothetical protein CVT26_003456 [Gymnopilus dilepis]
MVGIHIVTTPPNMPSAREEDMPSSLLESYLKQRSLTYIVKTICWSAALAEILVILASHMPASWLSREIISRLVFSGGDPKNIRLTGTFLLGTFSIAFGCYIRWACYRALGRLFTFRLALLKNHRLVTHGPYAWVRHPAYTGLMLMLFGLACWQISPGSYAVECGVLDTTVGKLLAFTNFGVMSSVTLGLLVRMPEEDKMLKRAFGAQWDEWATRVPYSVLPGIY